MGKKILVTFLITVHPYLSLLIRHNHLKPSKFQSIKNTKVFNRAKIHSNPLWNQIYFKTYSQNSIEMQKYSPLDPLPQRPAEIKGSKPADLKKILKKYFGHSDFRPGQLEVIQKLLKGESCLAVMPTAAGKSLCYQLPALVTNRGLTLVISPLLALMKDQVDSLLGLGIPCARIDSTLSAAESRAVFDNVSKGLISVLFVSPERFHNERFRKLMRKKKVGLMVVDEAHCISEWGHNFRPDYLRLAEFRKECFASTFLALTATASLRVADDIMNGFCISLDNFIQQPSFRPNLMLSMRPVVGGFDQKYQQLYNCLSSQEPGPTIVYVTLQKTSNLLQASLEEAGLNARAYHAGKSTEERDSVQNWFFESPPSENPIVVSTIAFGMGIDKSDIRYVYHFNMAKSIEGYTQETGRAGRDGNPALCETLLSAEDLPVLRAMVYSNTPSFQAIQKLLDGVFHNYRRPSHSKDFEEADVSIYDLSIETDIKPLVIRTLLAHLEMKGNLEELTSYFDSVQVILNDEEMDPEEVRKIRGLPPYCVPIFAQAQKQKASMRKNARWITLDSRVLSDSLEISPMDFFGGIESMAEYGLVQVGGRQGKVRSRYRILKLPTGDETSHLISTLFHTALDIQTRDLKRIDEVWHLLACSNGRGIAKRLLMFFDGNEEGADQIESGILAATSQNLKNDGACCTSNQNPNVNVLPEEAPPELKEIPPEKKKQLEESIKSEQLPLDDPYLIARFACGMTSPRIVKYRWNKHASFGCCQNVSFPTAISFAEDLITGLESP